MFNKKKKNKPKTSEERQREYKEYCGKATGRIKPKQKVEQQEIPYEG